MPNYKKMYFTLFNTVTDVIHDLQQAQQNGEESYIDSEDTQLAVLENPVNKVETTIE